MSATSKVLAAGVVALFLAAAGLVVSGQPVLFKFTEPGEIIRPTVTVFNPLRDRASEHVVENMFAELSRGEVRSAIARVHGITDDNFADKERRYRVRRWKLVDRVDDAGTVTLFYRADRGASGGLDSEATVCVQLQGTRWVVTAYRPVY